MTSFSVLIVGYIYKKQACLSEDMPAVIIKFDKCVSFT